MVSNRRLVDGEGPDFYPTPAWGTRALLKYETFTGTILEPCCGDGAMAEVLKETGCQVDASDLYDRGYGAQRDFFDCGDYYDNIITNPPFNIAEDVLDHALALYPVKVCLLLRTAFLESQSRYHRFYKKRPPARVYTFTQRLTMYPAGAEVKGGGTTSYSWFVWERGSDRTELRWIEPGLKEKI